MTSRAEALIEKNLPAADRTLGLEIIDGDADAASEALLMIERCQEALRTVGFMGGKKIVWLRNATFLYAGVVGKSAAVREGVQRLAATITSALPAGQRLIVTATQVDGRSSFFKACAARGVTQEYPLAKPWKRDHAAMAWTAEVLRQKGLAAAPDVIAQFVQKAGTETRLLCQEAEKLAIYVNARRPVQEQDITAIVSSTRELFAWDLQDAVADRDLPRAIATFQLLMAQQNEPIWMIICLENRFRNLMIFQEALARQWRTLQTSDSNFVKLSPGPKAAEGDDYLAAALAADHRLANPFTQAQLARQASAYRLADLQNCWQSILQTHQALVTSDHQIVKLRLEMLIIRICATRRPAPAIPATGSVPAGAGRTPH